MPLNAGLGIKKLIVRWDKKYRKAVKAHAKNPCEDTRYELEWCKKHLQQYKEMMANWLKQTQKR